MRHKILSAFALLALSSASCKSVGGANSRVSGFDSASSSLHDQIAQDLRVSALSGTEGSVWFESAMTLKPDFIIQSPDGYWGRPGSTLPKDLDCKAGEANCDAEFTRHLCSTDDDCAPFNTTCQPLEATVKAPGETPRRMCLGSGDQLLNRFYRGITRAEHHVDITSLSLPTGRFYPMLVNAVAYLSHKAGAPTIRILFAGKESKSLNVMNPPSTYLNDIVAKAKAQGADMSRLKIVMGYLAYNDVSWNHSKIVLADTNYVISGGHNYYDPDYLEDQPVFDLSLEYQGEAAKGVQNFVNRLWSESERNVHFIFNKIFPFDPKSASYPSGMDPQNIPWLNAQKASLKSIGTAGDVSMIGVGRMGYNTGLNPSDYAFRSMISHAEDSIYIAQEDIFSKIPLPVVGSVQQSLGQGVSEAMPSLIDAILRGVKVRIVQTDQAPTAEEVKNGKGLDGYGMVLASDVQRLMTKMLYKKVVNEKRNVTPQPGKTLAQTLCSMFEIAPWRYYSQDRTWSNGSRKIGSHPKLIMIDEKAFYVGSHNFYPANLQEFGVIITDKSVTQSFLNSYWNKLWENSSPSRLSCDRADSDLLQ